MKRPLLLCAMLTHVYLCSAKILHIGPGQVYADLAQAAPLAQPGDTLLFHAGTYAGGFYYANLQGTSAQPITLMAVPGQVVIHSGGGNAWQLTDAAHLVIQGMIFEKQTGNGLNCDDGGTYATPAHHLTFDHCTFRDINATGNNDLLKLSGLDSFRITSCTFLNGSPGGSGIDMVGCHYGVIEKCTFTNLGSNSIQAKGGAQFIRIERNFFKNGGQRTLNLGGSTGLQFFRPLDAPFEAADLQVHSNIFIGSQAPVAFVGCIHSEVINNTFYLPEKWVLRILQETVDPLKFLPCGDNTFRNNIIYRNNSVSTECNIGPNTDPGSFHFSNNLWYHAQNNSWGGPTDIPVVDSNALVGVNPLFINIATENFGIGTNSPAAGKGKNVGAPVKDFKGNGFASPRSIGAFEANPVSLLSEISSPLHMKFIPNPFRECTTLVVDASSDVPLRLMVYDITGKLVDQRILSGESIYCPDDLLEKGIYFYRANIGNISGSGRLFKE